MKQQKWIKELLGYKRRKSWKKEHVMLTLLDDAARKDPK